MSFFLKKRNLIKFLYIALPKNVKIKRWAEISINDGGNRKTYLNSMKLKEKYLASYCNTGIMKRTN